MNEINNYWETYKEEQPIKAEELTSLGIDMGSLSSDDSKEKIKAIECETQKLSCSIREIRSRFNRVLSFTIGDRLGLLDIYNKKILKESEELKIAKTNTVNSLYFKWILEAIEEEESEKNNQPLSDKSPEELLMMFALESEDEILMLQKLHIYHKGYSRGAMNFLFIRDMEEKFDKVIDQSLKPFLDNVEIKNDKNIFNLSLETNLSLIEDSIKGMDNLGSVIAEYNKRMISFYVELDMAINRARTKYRIV